MHEVLSNSVHFVAKKVPTVGNCVSPSLFLDQQNVNQSCLSTRGFYKCGHNVCKVCQHANVTKTFCPTSHKVPLPYDQKIHLLQFKMYYFFGNVCTLPIVECWVSNSLNTRIRRHLSDAVSCMAVNLSAVSRHFSIVHSGDVSVFSFSALKRTLWCTRGRFNEKTFVPRGILDL